MFVISLIVLVIIISVLLLYSFLKRRFQFWAKRNVPYLKTASVLGNFADYILLKKQIGQVTRNLCQKFPDVPYFGVFYGTEPTLVVQDPTVIKLVLATDFYYFSGREITKYNQKELLTKIIFFSGGDYWKVMRQNLTPLFSSAKMKNMFHLIQNCSQVFQNVLDQEIKISNVLEVRALMARFTMDCISACAFGVDTNTLDKKEDNPFCAIGNAIFDTRDSRGYKIVVRSIWPAIFYGLGFKLFPKEVKEFFHELLMAIFKGRQYKPTPRNDFVDLMLKLKNKKAISGDSITNSGEKVSIKVDDDLLISHCFAFFAAGFETSATTLSFTMYELAKHPGVQEKVIEEIDAFLLRHNNVLQHECVTEMPYLEACINETLRLYPVLGTLTREVSENYTFPSGLKVGKGLRVHIPVYHLHYNPDYFPDPEIFRPERFLGDEKLNIKPYTYMPFGEGQRICIGMRFAKMQMISGLIIMLKKYRVELAEGMKRELLLEPRAIVTQPVGEVNLKLIERHGWEHRVLKSSNVLREK